MRIPIFFVVLATLLIAGCQDDNRTIMSSPTPLTRDNWASITVTLPDNIFGDVADPIAGTTPNVAVKTVTVKISGPEIDGEMSQDLTFDTVKLAWTGTFLVPNGIDRLFRVEAKDALGLVIYSGENTVDVAAKSTVDLVINLWWDPTGKGRLKISVGFASPYLGIGKVPVGLGHFTGAGQDPNHGSIIPDAQYEAQVAVAKRYSNEVRTYAADEKSVRFFTAAGLKYWLGCWIGPNAVANEAEIAKVIDLAKRYAVEGIVVGNEVLLRGDQTEEYLVGVINRIKVATGKRVACADTWDIWRNGGASRPALAAAVDIVMIHCWPYWEGVGINDAVTAVANGYNTIHTLYPGKEIIIGETGWPTAGGTNGQAVPSELNQRRFLTTFVTWAKANNVKFFLFELFDEPWKNEPNGVGPHWGFCTSDLVIKTEINKVWF